MPVTLFTRNLLEEGALTVPAATGFPKERLFDRDRAPQWKGDAAAQKDVILDLGAGGGTASGWAIVNHNVGAHAIEVATSPDNITYTLRSSAAPGTADAFMATFTPASARYWRMRIPNLGVAAQIGELLLGVPVALPTPELAPDYVDTVVGNVQRDRSPAGYSWSVRRGASVRQFRFGWTSLEDADVDLLRQAYAEADEGAKKFLYVDAWGEAFWVEFLDDTLEVRLGAASTIQLQEAP